MGETMIGGKGQSHQQPTAAGTMISASPYGQAVPIIMGMTRVALLPIWAENLRNYGSGKKFKNKKKGIQSYAENIDFLIGSNPGLCVNQAWDNNNNLSPLNATSVTASSFSAVPGSVTISDPYFYSVIGVTVTTTYSQTFNDYGGNGSQTFSGSYEIPLWNEVLNGPDPTRAMGARVAPYTYIWTPGTNVVYFPEGGIFGDLPGSQCTIYYFQLSSVIGRKTPLANLRLSFEAILGSGSEYVGFTSQQIEYPQYFGVGSPYIDMGAAAAIPQITVETASANSRYPTGDCDFADMIEYTVKSGPVQAAIGSSAATSPSQTGASLYTYPGYVQQRLFTRNPGIGGVAAGPFLQPNTIGNFLLFYWCAATSGTPSGIVSALGNTPVVVDQGTNGTFNWIVGYVPVTVAGADTLTPNVGGDYGFSQRCEIAELAGVTAFDTSAAGNTTSSLSTVSLTTGNMRGASAFVYAAVGETSSVSGVDPRWASSAPYYYFGGSFRRTLMAPQTVSLAYTGSAARVVLMSFISANPPTFPKPFGNLLDDTSLDLCRTQCRANGLWGSIDQNTQRKASDWLKDFYYSMNAAPGFTGHKLYSFPRSEVSTVGNGAIYTAPTASGPVANLSDLNGDFVGTKPIVLKHQPRFGLPDIIQIQHYNRGSQYQQVVTSEPESASALLLGVRKGSPSVHNEIQDPAVARPLILIEGRRNQYIVPWVYTFTLQPKWDLLSLYDLVTITDSLGGITALPVRLTKVTYAKDGTVQCEAEPFLYGIHAPNNINTNATTPYNPALDADPGPVNTPIIFEPVPRLFGSASTPEIWIVVSNGNTAYGGCVVYLSTDGGSTYNAVGTINGNGITGVTTADWPIASDPDTTNNLPLNLTESLGTLSSYSTADRDNFTYPCYIAGGTASIPYGLMTYNAATLTGTNLYTLAATGGGNELRRCVFGAPTVGTDVDHPSGSRWAFLGNPTQANPPGLLALQMDPKWIGVTLYFKFLPFNSFGNTIESITSQTAYTFTPTGIPGTLQTPGPNNYSNNPEISLSQTNATTIAMAQVKTTFSGLTVNYNARTLTITAPSSPTWYYVYITDPGQIGDTGSGTNLTPIISTSQANIGVPGYTFMGAIQALPSGFASAVALPGGYPTPNANIFG
jgi:hypothetical protein